MRRRPQPPELPRRVRARPRPSQACSRTPSAIPGVLAHPTQPVATGTVRATVGRSSSGGMDAAGASVFARDASLQDAGGRARSRGPEGRHRQAEPTPEHSRASPHDAGGFRCAGTTRVEPQGCGGAATRPHAAHPTSDQPRPSRRMRRRPRNPRSAPGVFAHTLDNPNRVRARPRQSQACSRTPRQEQAPPAPTASAPPAWGPRPFRIR